MRNVTIGNRDVYTWLVHYEDGGTLAEFDEGGTDHGFGELEAGRTVAAVELKPWQGRPNGFRAAYLPKPLLAVPPGATPVFFRRRSIDVDPNTEAEVGRRTLTCLGWERDGHGAYLFVADDGACVLTADRNAV